MVRKTVSSGLVALSLLCAPCNADRPLSAQQTRQNYLEKASKAPLAVAYSPEAAMRIKGLRLLTLMVMLGHAYPEAYTATEATATDRACNLDRLSLLAALALQKQYVSEAVSAAIDALQPSDMTSCYAALELLDVCQTVDQKHTKSFQVAQDMVASLEEDAKPAKERAIHRGEMRKAHPPQKYLSIWQPNFLASDLAPVTISKTCVIQKK